MTLPISTTPPLPGATLAAAVNNAIRSLAGSPKGTIASAPTTDIGSVDSLFVEVSGVVTITGFGSNAALIQDQFKWVRFTGALRVTFNAVSLITPTGLDILTQPGDMLFLSYLGAGNWKALAYLPATFTGARTLFSTNTTFFVRTAPQSITFTNASANISWPVHGLQVNDPVVINMAPNTATCTCTAANPGVFTLVGHGFPVAQPVIFSSSGYLPASIIPGTTYFVTNDGNKTANTFAVSDTAAHATAGTNQINTTKVVFTASNSGGNLLLSTAGAVAHNLVVGQLVAVSNSGGGLPGGLSASTGYYVSATGFTASAFEVSTTNGGAPIAFTTAGTGTQSLEQVGGTVAQNFNAGTATHYCARAGAMPTFSIAGLLVQGTTYFVGTVVDANTITLSTTLNNANPLGTATVATGSPSYAASTGNDTNNGLTGTRTGALLTIQRAYDLLAGKYDTAGLTAIIQLADGVYLAGLAVGTAWSGGGKIILLGNTPFPANVVISTAGAAINVLTPLPAQLTLQGFLVTSSVTFGIAMQASGSLSIVSMWFGACAAIQIYSGAPGSFIIANNYVIVGSASEHALCNFGGGFAPVGAKITLLGVPNFAAAYAYVTRLSWQGDDSLTFIGSATGPRYLIDTGGVIYTGAGGPNYFPGNVAGAGGTTAGGGFYV